MTVQLATGRYSTFEPSLGVPVAITLGKPKFPLRYIVAAEIDELKPRGLFGVKDPAEFERRFRAQLDRIGVDALARRFEAIGSQHGGQRLVLLCFEKAGDESCHRRSFARWWLERTGQPVEEIEPPAAQLQLTPEARAEAQAVLDRAARRVLKEGYRTGADGRLIPPQRAHDQTGGTER